MKKLGEKIWRLREEKGLSQEALAERIEVSRQTISNWENDKATPDAYKLKQLCEALGVTADELLETGAPVADEKQTGSPQKDADPIARATGTKPVFRIVLFSVLGVVAVGLLAAAVILFALPAGEKTQAITSALTLTPTMCGVLLLALAAVLLVVVVFMVFKKSK